MNEARGVRFERDEIKLEGWGRRDLTLTLTTNVFNSWKMTFSHSFSCGKGSGKFLLASSAGSSVP
eukprot:762577-Hanusia_phi.AAC.4